MSDTPRRRVPSSVQRPPKVPQPPELSLERARTTAKRILGEEGRLIAGFTSRYFEKRPTNFAVFNGNVVTLIGKRFEKVWSGDLDLTLSEGRLAALARLLDREIFLFHDGDALSARRPDPRSIAIITINACGETEIGSSEEAHIFRAEDGTLRRHIPPAPSRFYWRVLRHRPALLHFWRLSIKGIARYGFKTWTAYVGRLNDHYVTPLLVLAYRREKTARIRGRSIEWTWYPANRTERYAPKPLIGLYPRVNVRSFNYWAHVVVWPGFCYRFLAGIQQRL